MGKASQAAFERGFIAGVHHEQLHRDIEAWRSKAHAPYPQPSRPFGGYAAGNDPKDGAVSGKARAVDLKVSKVSLSDLRGFPAFKEWAEMKLDPEKVATSGFASARAWVKHPRVQQRPKVQQSFGKGSMFEPVDHAFTGAADDETDAMYERPETNEQIDARLNAELEALGIGKPVETKATKPHVLVANEDCETYNLCTVHPAHPASVKLVLDAPERTEDGRSEYLWCRFANGDLMLGVFPRGTTYDSVEQYAEYPGDVK